MRVKVYNQVLEALYQEEPQGRYEKPSQYHPRIESKARVITKEITKLQLLGLETLDYQGYKDRLEEEVKRRMRQAKLTKELVS